MISVIDINVALCANLVAAWVGDQEISSRGAIFGG